MKKTFSILSMTVLLLMAACQKDQQQPAVSGSISGTLSTYDPATPLVTTPAEGIKLWLVDYDYPFDTVTYIDNEQAILDSTFTDAQGNYSFSHLSFGNYAVVPIPDTADYRFEPTDPELPITLTEADPSKEVSYSAAWPGGENDDYFHIHLLVKNNPGNRFWYNVKRQYFSACFPYFIDQATQVYFNDTVFYNADYSWGYFLWGCAETNNFLYDFIGPTGVEESYWITQWLWSTPNESWWTIDLSAHTIVRDSAVYYYKKNDEIYP